MESKGKMIKIATPWDGSLAQIVIRQGMSRYDKERLLEQKRCMYGVCNNHWTFLVVGKQKGYVQYGYCWHCMELRLAKELLAGVDHNLIDRIWVINKGKLKKATSWLSDITELVDRFKKRIQKEEE